MAKGITAVQSRTKPKETVSFPILTYTDALPRNDLHSLNEATQRLPEATVTEQWDFSHPPTGDGWIRKPSSAQATAQVATFDFRLTAPPDEAIQSSVRSDRFPTEQNMIGIALGSPSMVDKNEPLPPPRFDTSIFAPERDLPPKPSKWKKIGGLFKAKNAFASPPDGAQESNYKQSKEDQAQEKSRKTREGDKSTEEWPKLELDPPKMPTQRSRNFSLSGNPFNNQQSNQGLLLSVDIPDIQMERYSVMFGNVVNNNERPSLLARRAKTLDKLSVPDAIHFLKSPSPPPMPQRRATSPARSGFNIFPTSQPSKAAEILGTKNFSRGPGPLVRANTLPIDSPSKTLPPPPHHAANVGSLSSFESPVIPKLFSEKSGTRGSSSSYDKPLPAIKPEPQPTRLQQSIQPQKDTPSPQQIRSQQGAQPLGTAVSINESKPVEIQKNVRPQRDALPLQNILSEQCAKPQRSTVPELDPQSTGTQKDVRPSKNTPYPQKAQSKGTLQPQSVAVSVGKQQPSRSQQSIQPQNDTLTQNTTSQRSVQAHNSGTTKAGAQPMDLHKDARPQKSTMPPQKMRTQQSSHSQKILKPHNMQPIIARQPVFQPRKDSLPQATQKQHQGPSPPSKTTQHQPHYPIDNHQPDNTSRPRLRVQTQGRPQPPAKDTPSSSTLLSASPRSTPIPEKIDRIMTPLSASTGPRSGVSPSDSTRMPFVDTVETVATAEEDPEPEPGPERSIPKVEVSIARSVSVSRAKRQMIVPIGARVDQLDPDERFVQRRPMTPQITDAHRGHRPGVSQQLRIECL